MLVSLTPLINKVEGWLNTLYQHLPNIVMAILALILMYFVAKLIRKSLTKLLDKTYHNQELSAIIAKVVYVIIIGVGLMWALSILNLNKTVTSLLAGAGIVGLALSFAFQDLATNFVSGFMMAAKRPFEIGDVIEVDGYIGEVLAINLRSTQIMTFDGNEVVIPNKTLFQNALTNYYKTKTRRVDLEVGVAYDSDLDHVEKTCLAAVEDMKNRVEGTETRVIYTEFGGSSINLKIHYWVKYDSYIQYLEGISDGVRTIKKAFDREGINIPFPIRTIEYKDKK